jgi:hypothetical protein
MYAPTGLGPILYHLVYIGPILYCRRGSMLYVPKNNRSWVNPVSPRIHWTNAVLPAGAYVVCPNRSWANPVSPRIHWSNAVCRRTHWANPVLSDTHWTNPVSPGIPRANPVCPRTHWANPVLLETHRVNAACPSMHSTYPDSHRQRTHSHSQASTNLTLYHHCCRIWILTSSTKASIATTCREKQ